MRNKHLQKEDDMRNYTTQMDAARKGIITPEMKEVAKKEYRTEEEIRDLVARGHITLTSRLGEPPTIFTSPTTIFDKFII